jgi:hypothetical protein
MKRRDTDSIHSAGSLLAALAGRIGIAVIFLAVALPLFAADTTNVYTNWIKPWTERPATSAALAGAGLKLIVSNVRGEADKTTVVAMTPLQRLDLAYHIRVSAMEVATNGGCRSYVVSNTDARTSDVRWLSPAEISELDQLLGQLPADDSQLPPPGNRVVLQIWADDQWHVHVYNGNDLPPEVEAVLSLLAKPYAKLF